MPYDASLDECIAAKHYDYEGGRIVASVFSYNKGTKKLQLSRENAAADGNMRFAKLGRMTRDEVAGVLPLMQELVSQLDA